MALFLKPVCVQERQLMVPRGPGIQMCVDDMSGTRQKKVLGPCCGTRIKGRLYSG